MNNTDFNNLPKSFANQAVLGQCKDALMFIFMSGSIPFGFVTTPSQFKIFVKAFQDQLAMYEKEYGPVDVSHALIPSVFQIDSLKKPPEDKV